MASGVTLNDSVLKIFEDMKVRAAKPNADPMKVVSLHINNGQICVTEQLKKSFFDDKDVFEFVFGSLTKDKSCYIMYDCHYETNESPKQDMVLLTWCPDTGPIKERMLYSASKESLTRGLNGFKHSLHFNGMDEFSTREDFARNLGKGIISLEGVKLKPKTFQTHVKNPCTKH